MNWNLEPNEPLLWEGRPDTKLHFGIETIATAIFALIVIAACTGVGWLISSQTGGAGWPFVVLGVAFALLIIVLFPVLNMRKRRNTWYAVTDRRAFIHCTTNRQKRHRNQDGYRLNEHSEITLKAGGLSTIWFAELRLDGPNAGAQDGCQMVNVGFERISDGEKVYQLLLDVVTYNKTT